LTRDDYNYNHDYNQAALGDPTRDKYIPYLAKCLELGYISPEEHGRRTDLLLSPELTRAKLHEVLKHLPWKEWSDAWDRGRRRGIHAKSEVLPGKRDHPYPHAETGTPVWAALAILGCGLGLGFLLAYLIMILQ